jgi:hypothetical protein
VDAHNIKTYSRKAMKQSFITQEAHYGKAIRTFYSQDQASKNRSSPWLPTPAPPSLRAPIN